MRAARLCGVIAVVVIGAAGCAKRREARREPPLAATVQHGPSKELGHPRPIFGVADLQTSLAYYRDRLGFTIDWEYGEPADFASVTRGDTTIFLGEVGHGQVGQAAHAGGGALWVTTREVDRLHAELKKHGAIVKLPPTDMPWGARELHVADPDGNVLRLAGPRRK